MAAPIINGLTNPSFFQQEPTHLLYKLLSAHYFEKQVQVWKGAKEMRIQFSCWKSTDESILSVVKNIVWKCTVALLTHRSKLSQLFMRVWLSIWQNLRLDWPLKSVPILARRHRSFCVFGTHPQTLSNHQRALWQDSPEENEICKVRIINLVMCPKLPGKTV